MICGKSMETKDWRCEKANAFFQLLQMAGTEDGENDEKQ
jgi:hypothetical protein